MVMISLILFAITLIVGIGASPFEHPTQCSLATRECKLQSGNETLCDWCKKSIELVKMQITSEELTEQIDAIISVVCAPFLAWKPQCQTLLIMVWRAAVQEVAILPTESVCELVDLCP
ncbi:hypothetical protein EG68_00261 [Paragonimus skrjabini miyazakii]|uniref:Saposin B-type domain-containing protein n=1 Tax=Paragonimus skrjabini miyazakii TaxID=59628 RepID=A0A8S9Z6D4_9TREM|nr:hypothetical protein EG68_00261 [Paragonimus skrjabini miyazakii]